MSPIRVEAVDEFEVPHILTANIAKQPDTSKVINVVERLVLRDKYNPSAAAKCIAHLKASSTNSIVVASYYIHEFTTPLQYVGLSTKCYRLCRAGTLDFAADSAMTLADCLTLAVKDYCLLNHLEIVNSL